MWETVSSPPLSFLVCASGRGIRIGVKYSEKCVIVSEQLETLPIEV